MPTAKQLQNAKKKLKKTTKPTGNTPKITHLHSSSSHCGRPKDSSKQRIHENGSRTLKEEVRNSLHRVLVGVA
jgi:hypothetical protein